MKKKSRKTYAIYNKDDELVFVGDYEECSEYIDVNKKSFRAAKYSHENPRKWHIVEIEEEKENE